MTGAQASWLLVGWGVYPLLLLAGLADWACHRRSRIEATAGLRENALHWLMFGQLGAGVLAVALLEFTWAVLAFGLLVAAVHELTVWLELRFTVSRREVSPIEQVVHSFMELLPVMGLALLALGHWQALAAADWALRLRASVDGLALLGAGVAALAVNVLPLAEETLRCLRHEGHPAPAGGAGQPSRRIPPPPAPR